MYLLILIFIYLMKGALALKEEIHFDAYPLQAG